MHTQPSFTPCSPFVSLSIPFVKFDLHDVNIRQNACSERKWKGGVKPFSIFIRSLDRLILNFPRLIIKLKPLLSCKIAEIVMKRSFLLAQEYNYDEMRPEQIALFEGEGNI